jgi:transcriptional regulator with XRE-family HTH domain
MGGYADHAGRMARKPQARHAPVDARLTPLGHSLKRARESKDMTLDELQNKTGIDRNTINRYENLRINPSVLGLLKIAHGLDVNVSELIKALDHKPEPERAEG